MIGFLNVYKERGITSHDVINRLRKISGIKQIGHGGTLDPMAEGVMAVAVGKACRLLPFINDDKTYLAEVKLGQTTDTDDLEGKTLSLSRDVSHVTGEDIEKALKTFVGKQQQIPPVYSAIKKGGVKMYELARKGEAPEELEARSVEMYSVDLLSHDLPFVTVRVACSKGTYIRSLARDLGRMLGTGGCLSKLVREQSGPFMLANAKTIEELDKGKAAFKDFLLSLEDSLEIERLALERDIAKKLAHGQALDINAISSTQSLSRELYIASLDGSPIALVRVRDGKLIQPEVVLANAGDL